MDRDIKDYPCEDHKRELLFCLLRSSCCQEKRLTPRQCLEGDKLPSECKELYRRFNLCRIELVGFSLIFTISRLIEGPDHEVVVTHLSNKYTEMTVFVTVGTTSFDQLITEINNPSFGEAILMLGYNRLIVQYGSGSTIPNKSLIVNNNVDVPDSHLDVVAFRYRNDIKSCFAEANLVISHGGAGTCLEALTPPGLRKLIIVVNESLMKNHQYELAHTLLAGGHALVTTPDQLMKLLTCGRTLPLFKDDAKLYEGFCSDVQDLLGSATTPEEAGFVKFARGDPLKLKHYLDSSFGFLACHSDPQTS